MLPLLRLLTAIADALVRAPWRVMRLFGQAVAFNPKLGPLRHVLTAAVAYVIFALVLVYVVAPLRAWRAA